MRSHRRHLGCSDEVSNRGTAGPEAVRLNAAQAACRRPTETGILPSTPYMATQEEQPSYF
jgi:hypothetical protein